MAISIAKVLWVQIKIIIVRSLSTNEIRKFSVFPAVKKYSYQYEHPFSNPSYSPEWTSQELSGQVNLLKWGLT